MKWYLCGPFWDKDCNEFFNNFIGRCSETRIDNSDYLRNKSEEGLKSLSKNSYIEDLAYSSDKVFVPGHFKVDFNKVKSEYDTESFRRVLGQILRLDLDNIDGNTGLVVYPKGYDLGSMFELGYFLAMNSDGGLYSGFNSLRKKLIIKDPDRELKRCINLFLGKYIRNHTRTYSSSSSGILLSDGSGNFSDPGRDFGLIGLNVDKYKSTPFNSMLAGYLYAIQIPFFTYSTQNNDSNVMMIASSLFHLKLEPDDDMFTEKYIEENVNNFFWDNSYFDKFNDIK